MFWSELKYPYPVIMIIFYMNVFPIQNSVVKLSVMFINCNLAFSNV